MRLLTFLAFLLAAPFALRCLAARRAAKWIGSRAFIVHDFGPVSRAGRFDRIAVVASIAATLAAAGVDEHEFYARVPAPGGRRVNLSARDFMHALGKHPHRLRGEPDPYVPPAPARAGRLLWLAVLCAMAALPWAGRSAADGDTWETAASTSVVLCLVALRREMARARPR